MALPLRKVVWYRITTPRYVIGVETKGGKITFAPPIAAWAIGKGFGYYQGGCFPSLVEMLKSKYKVLLDIKKSFL